MVQHIEVPAEFYEFAHGWYEGSDSMLYAIVSTGNLELGNRRPRHDDGTPLTDEEWQVLLFDSLDVELCQLERQLSRAKQVPEYHRDICHRFQTWAEETANQLRQQYKLEE